MTLRLHPDVSTTDTDAGVVLLHMSTGRYWQLNLTGTHILRRLLDGCRPSHIATDLAGRYELPSSEAHGDVGALLVELCTTGLVITS
ncbi:lasso peptide biosynthesis PqqD family chaperone [Amycolatopsis thailandensis]|uniref:lasso peptide biosynthesis PqqD family chaperone n=1 Tax=Amycolatopsis thailandensis TaxID=589330 RepID=UPI00362FA0AE